MYRNLIFVLGMVVCLELGEKMAERFLPIYILAIGGSNLMIGVLNGLDNFLGAVTSYPGGLLSDKLGHKRAMLIFNLLALVGYLLIIFIPSWPFVVLGAILFISWSSLSLPAVMVVISKDLPPAKQTYGVSLHSIVRRVPMALGPLLCGLFIQLYGEREGIRLAFAVAFCLALISIIVQHFLVKETSLPIKTKTQHSFSPWKLFFNMPPALKHLLVSDILIRFCEQIPYAFVVIWCVKIIKISPVEFGVLTSVEMATAILIYFPVAYLVEKWQIKKPFVVTTFIFFSLFPIILLYSTSFSWLLFAFLIRGLKEFGEPTRKALILQLAPADQKGSTYGTYYLIRDLIVSVAALLGALLWSYSPTINLLLSSTFGFLGVLYLSLYCKE